MTQGCAVCVILAVIYLTNVIFCTVENCTIPAVLQGEFYSFDRRPNFMIDVNDNLIALSKYEIDDYALQNKLETVEYRCVVIREEHDSGSLQRANIWTQNIISNDFKCFHIDVLTETGNAQRWMETTEFEEEEYLIEVCNKTTSYRRHSPITTDGDYHFRLGGEESICDEPFNETLSFKYKNAPVEDDSQPSHTCMSHANQMVASDNSIVEISWSTCDGVKGVSVDGQNFSLTCQGSWTTDGLVTYLMKKTDQSYPRQAFICLWSSLDNRFEISKGISIEDCSMTRNNRRADILIDVETETGSAVMNAPTSLALWLLLLMLPASWCLE